MARQILFTVFLGGLEEVWDGSDTPALHESGRENLRLGDRGAFGHVGEGGVVHQVRQVVSCVEKDTAESAKRLLSAAFVAAD